MQSERSTDRCDRDVMLSSAAGDRRGRQRVSTITKGMICGPATFKTSQLTKGGLSVPGTNHSSLYLAVVRGRDNFPHHSILLTHLHNTPMLCAWSFVELWYRNLLFFISIFFLLCCPWIMDAAPEIRDPL